MKQDCKGCGSPYYFEDAKIPPEGISFKCPKCGSMVQFGGQGKVNIAETKTRPEPDSNRKSFFEMLSATFAYPFKGGGIFILLAGAVFFGLSKFVLWLGIFVAGSTTGYLCAYLIKIIKSSANGDEHVPDFPDFTNWWDDIVVPAFLILGTVFVCEIPALAYGLGGIFMNYQVSDAMSILLALPGLFYLPMGMLGVALMDSLAGLNPVYIIPSISRVFGRYIIALFFLAVILLLQIGLKELPAIPFLGLFIKAFFDLYFLMVMGRVLGLIYYENKSVLSWFGEDQ